MPPSKSNTQQPSHEFIDTVLHALPNELQTSTTALITGLTPENLSSLENLVRILAGAPQPAPGSTAALLSEWSAAVSKIRACISERVAGASPTALSSLPPPDKKRGREDEDESISKRPRVSPPPPTAINSNANGDASTSSSALGVPAFTLHSVSTTSPIRKKVDIMIASNGIVLVNPSSRATEATLPLSYIRRAFVVPTRGKTKGHWTVILMGTDCVIEEKKGKGANANGSASGASPAEQQQLIFGLDATSSAIFNTSSYSSTSPNSPPVLNQTANPKGTPTLPLIKTFLSHLPPSTTVLYPTPSVFKSACPPLTGPSSSASPGGIPGVEAYKGAKVGTLWFMKEGILWGESKPCEFWALEDVVRPGKAHAGTDGIKVVASAAGGRTCSVVIMRKQLGGAEDGEEEDGDETEFGMIDGRERDGIQQWIQIHRARFGWKPPTNATNDPSGSSSSTAAAPPAAPKLKTPSGPTTIHTLMLEDDDDDEDEDFADDESLSGSERSSGSESDNDSSGDEDEAEGTGDEDDAEGDNDGEEEDGPLDPAKHPLLKPGAMPKRISKSALEMAANLVEGDMLGHTVDDEDEDMEDELDD